jgi:arabinan endo-1,5-alpha-L-arabinosidase
MKFRVLASAVLLAAAIPALLSFGPPGPPALDGAPYIHDPSTIMMCDGKFYTFGTGGGGLISDDGWTWHREPCPGGGVAPDIIHIERYNITYAGA